MGKSQRTKGKVGEREAAALLTDLLGVECKRSYQQSRSGSDAPDVVCGDLPLWVEVKRGKRPLPIAALQQAIEAKAQSGDCHAHVPIALTRADHGEWIVTLRASDLPEVALLVAVGMEKQAPITFPIPGETV